MDLKLILTDCDEDHLSDRSYDFRNDSSINSPESSPSSKVSELVQIDCSFVDVNPIVISEIISSIHSKNSSQYKSAMNFLLESCMSKSLEYLSLLKVEPLTSSEKINFDPNPDRDEYIIKNKNEYGRLQYMCDYFKYYMTGNCLEVVSPTDEFIVNCIEEKRCAERINVIKRKTNADKCHRYEAKYGPTVNVPPIGTDYRILYTRTGYSLKLLLEKFMQSEIYADRKKFTNPGLISKFIVPGSGSAKKLIINNGMIKKIRASSNNCISASDWYASSFMKYHLFLGEKFQQISCAKKSIVNESSNLNNIINAKKSLRDADLKTRDMIINSLMKYYLSLKDKFEYIYRCRFNSESEFTKEFDLPVPKELSLLEQKLSSEEYHHKIDSDMKIVRSRMNNYLSKIDYKDRESREFYKEKNMILIKNKYKTYTIKYEDTENTSTVRLHKKYESETVKDEGINIFTRKISRSIVITGSCLIPLKSSNFISGINISSITKQIDPGLVDHRSIADIICSIDNNDIHRYKSAINIFTARFMSRSLQYVRALNVDLPYCNDSYYNDYHSDPDLDEYIVQSEGEYKRLQYMCDYFKYYILESQLESLAYEETSIREDLPLLSTINTEEEKHGPHTGIEFSAEEYDLLIKSIKIECLQLMENRKKLIFDIDKHKTKIKLLLRPLDCPVRDELIKCLMEYYLLIIDKFESIADLEFKNINRPLTEKFILPVPKVAAEIVHREIHTRQTVYGYNVAFRENFFCDENNCLCTDNHGYSPFTAIRRLIMETVADRMKNYLLSLNNE
ncbi:hypothetical protein [Candidatus Ichthyocystis hellenicum]|uniref:hypothetical protein n=1 Tax=Candidatus Ichthyocystis hellenicum TaxID=1561003 RepID=UPI000B86C066|nr:hypothetical protein [Candidatus Ichthyocystis hellenicum]